MIGILIGKGFQSIIAYIPNSYFSKQLIGYSVKEQSANILPSLGVATSVSFFVFVLQNIMTMPPFATLVVCGVIGIVMYILMAKFLKLSAYQLAEGLVCKGLPSRAEAA